MNTVLWGMIFRGTTDGLSKVRACLRWRVPASQKIGSFVYLRVCCGAERRGGRFLSVISLPGAGLFGRYHFLEMVVDGVLER